MHRGRSLDVVVSADIEHAHWAQIVQPERFAAANVAVELIDVFCEPDLAMPEVYELLTGALGAIGASEEPLALLPRFSLRLLGALGLAPPLHECVRCGAVLERSAWLDQEQSGFAGPECAQAWRDPLAFDEEDLTNIRALAAPRGGTVRPAVRATARVARAIETLVNDHLGRRPKSGAHALLMRGS